MIDYGAILYDPIYAELGVPAVLSTTTTAGNVDITVIDDTRAKSMTTGSLETKSVGPGAFARVYELVEEGIDRSQFKELVGSFLSFNNRQWRIYSYELRGSPNGEHKGEIRLSLEKPGPVDVTA